jgi:malate synthase
MLNIHLAATDLGAPLGERARTEILTPDALELLGELHRRFDAGRGALLDARAERRAILATGGSLDFLDPGSDARAGDWRVAPPRDDYADRPSRSRARPTASSSSTP